MGAPFLLGLFHVSLYNAYLWACKFPRVAGTDSTNTLRSGHDTSPGFRAFMNQYVHL